MSMCDAVIACIADGKLSQVATRAVLVDGYPAQYIGFTREKWLAQIEVVHHVTESGQHVVINQNRSPIIESRLPLDEPLSIRRRRMYSFTESDFRTEQVNFDVAEYVKFAKKFMRHWKEGLTCVKDTDLPEGYYSPAALDAIQRGLATPSRV